jgi:hypothetical protein
MMIEDFRDEYTRYRQLGEGALRQIPDEALNVIHAPEGNSAAMIVWHMSGNLRSRFTDFLTSDGEKPWRQRDEEFENRTVTRAEVEAKWIAGWQVLESALASLTDEDMPRKVIIRGVPLTVHAALCRSVSHAASHVGQLIFIGRMTAADWKSLSIPRGGSTAYNANPTKG